MDATEHTRRPDESEHGGRNPGTATPADAPLLQAKEHNEPSLFTPDALLREARRQKQLEVTRVPGICVLDPDGDIVRYLTESAQATPDESWPGYHTKLYRFSCAGRELGIIGCAVGAPFAVLVAEQLFAAGCRLLVGITSAGQVRVVDTPPYFVLIDRALRDEGTSYHYAEARPFAAIGRGLLDKLLQVREHISEPLHVGAAWTTDAPFRETESALQAVKERPENILAVEMEAAALYTFAAVRKREVVCFAHVTNQMGVDGDDFEKGEANGSIAALRLIESITRLDGRRKQQEGVSVV